MKKVIGISLLCLAVLMMILPGCTEEEPGYVVTTSDSEVMVVDSDGDIILIDEDTRSLTIIGQEHQEIHCGDSFSCWYLQDVSDTGDKSIIAFKTSATTKWIHLVPAGSATVVAHYRLYEAPVITDNTGATLAIYNRDRNSATTSTVIDTSTTPDTVGQAMYFTEATMGNVVGGTEITHEHLGTGEGKKTLGATTRGTQEWILKQDTFYAFIIESINDDDNTHVVLLNWYEHTNY